MLLCSGSSKMIVSSFVASCLCVLALKDGMKTDLEVLYTLLHSLDDSSYGSQVPNLLTCRALEIF